MLAITIGHPNFIIRLLHKAEPSFAVSWGRKTIGGDRVAISEIKSASGLDEESMFQHKVDLTDDEAMSAVRAGSIKISVGGELLEPSVPVMLAWGGDPVSRPPGDDAKAKAAEHKAEQALFDRLRPGLLDLAS